MTSTPISAPIPTNRLAISSFICGLMGWLITVLLICFNATLGALITLATLGLAALCLIPLGCIAPTVWIVGVVTGHMGLSQIKRTGEGGHGLAITGLIMSYLGLGILLCSIVGAILLIVLGGLGAMLPLLGQPTR